MRSFPGETFSVLLTAIDRRFAKKTASKGDKRLPVPISLFSFFLAILETGFAFTLGEAVSPPSGNRVMRGGILGSLGFCTWGKAQPSTANISCHWMTKMGGIDRFTHFAEIKQILLLFLGLSLRCRTEYTTNGKNRQQCLAYVITAGIDSVAHSEECGA